MISLTVYEGYDSVWVEWETMLFELTEVKARELAAALTEIADAPNEALRTIEVQ